MEQYLVSALGIRRHQLHAQLGVRLLCGAGLLDRRVHLDDAAEEAGIVSRGWIHVIVSAPSNADREIAKIRVRARSW